MAKIVSDLSGDVRKGVFYAFDTMYEDVPYVPYGKPTPESIIAPRMPTRDALIAANLPSYLYINEDPREADHVEIKDCPANPNHVTLDYYKSLHVNLEGGPRIAPFAPTWTSRFIVVSDELRKRLEALKLRGTRLDLVAIGDNATDVKDAKLWNLQFLGRARTRLPRFADTANQCPQCGRGKIVCESCGYWIPLCENCGQQMHILENVHKGNGDKRIPVENGLQTVLDGKTWDGSDLVHSRLASKRFIDWLLRIHAAPFYAEPVYFCVDGMSDQQKKWFDDLQKPFEV